LPGHNDHDDDDDDDDLSFVISNFVAMFVIFVTLSVTENVMKL